MSPCHRAAALALCDADFRARLGLFLAGAAAVVPRALTCSTFFLLVPSLP
jgi:hypothetical protein